MKVSELWLREWVNPSMSGEQLAAQLTMAGLEVDGLNPVAGMFDHVVVAEVLKTQPHPQADKLTLCEVSTGTTQYKIVCGAANVRDGLKVALALPGANLPGDIHIKESMLRGELSQGMLCSVAELRLEEASAGIMELPEDAPLGMDLRAYLSLDDQVLDIDLTPNRADCFSVLGIAREVAALNNLPIQSFAENVIQPESDAELTTTLEAFAACPQYCGRVIHAINADATTPLWIKERLRRSGVRPLHPVVDVTNYVMLELGQPMHAFDLKAIKGNITVRYAEKDESLKLLNGQEITLADHVLVIADENNPLAIAGIMGGETSAVQADTTDIFLESAYFNPKTIAGIARRYGLCTDSSQRFERGVDPDLQIRALERATELLKNIVGGKVGPISINNNAEHLPKKARIVFDPTQVKRLSGVDISLEEMRSQLKNLGMEITEHQQKWTIESPSYRFDIQQEVDLVEEIVRLYGYEKIKAQPMITEVKGGVIDAREELLSKIAAFLKYRGYQETISYSFVDPELQQAIYPEAQTLQLLNPISQELSQMRVGLWPGLIASMMYNIHRQQTAIQLFEAGVVFNIHEQGLHEKLCLAGLLTGEQGGNNWSEVPRKFDFFDLKGDLQALFAAFHIPNPEFLAIAHPALHPGQSAKIMVDGKDAGWIGALHPRLLDALDISGEVLVFELTLECLLKRVVPRYKMISKYPQIKRDLSLLVSEKISVAEIEKAVREVVEVNLLKGFDVFDVYIGASIPEGKKSLAVTLTLQDDKRTMVDAEINIIISAIINKLYDKFAITLRD